MIERFVVPIIAILALAPGASAQGRITLNPLELEMVCHKDQEFCKPLQVWDIAHMRSNIEAINWINSHVNKSIRPIQDTALVWRYFPKAGDCNDYAYTKAKLLRRYFPAGALSLAVVDVKGQAHLVNLVRTEKEIMVLDNLKKKPSRLEEYHVLKTMDFENPRIWRE